MNPLCRVALPFLLALAITPTAHADGKMSAAPAPEQITPHLARELTGTYRFSPDHEVTLAPFDEFGGSLVMIDLKTLEQRILFLQPDATFHVGTTTLNATPRQATIAFLRDPNGFPGTLNWVPADGSGARKATRVYPTRHEDVTFRNGDVELHGTLSIPVGPGPHPAVVLVHGSGAATRRIGFFTSIYERLGIATLSVDKRGAGESTGNW